MTADNHVRQLLRRGLNLRARTAAVGADAAAMGSGALAPGQRWSASRNRDVVLRLLRGEPLDEVYRLERWKARALGYRQHSC